MQNESFMRLTVEKRGPKIGIRTGVFWIRTASELLQFIRACEDFREIDAKHFGKHYTTHYSIKVDTPLYLKSVPAFIVKGYNS
jgi:hypothetical protein